MGSRDADCGRGLGGTEAPQMTGLTESVTPEGLRSRAGIMRLNGDDSCARHLELAAAEIARLRSQVAAVSQEDPLDDEAFMAKSYRIDIDNQDKTARVVFFREPKQKVVLGYMIMECEEIYYFASALLRDYDKLEGI